MQLTISPTGRPPPGSWYLLYHTCRLEKQPHKTPTPTHTPIPPNSLRYLDSRLHLISMSTELERHPVHRYQCQQGVERERSPSLPPFPPSSVISPVWKGGGPQIQDGGLQYSYIPHHHHRISRVNESLSKQLHKHDTQWPNRLPYRSLLITRIIPVPHYAYIQPLPLPLPLPLS